MKLFQSHTYLFLLKVHLTGFRLQIWSGNCLSLEWRAGRGSKCIIFFNLIHEKTVLNFEDVSKFQNFMIFIDILQNENGEIFKINFSDESMILEFLHYFFDFLIFLAP